MSEPNLSSFIWSVADLLRGDYKQSEYGKVILPFTVLVRDIFEHFEFHTQIDKLAKAGLLYLNAAGLVARRCPLRIKAGSTAARR